MGFNLLKFFFNRKGLVIYSLTALGWLLTGGNSYFLVKNYSSQNFQTILWFFIFLSLSLLIMIIRLIPWNKRKDRGHGIEEHFEKTLVPLAYILVVIQGVYFFWKTGWGLFILGVLLLLPILYVNTILIYFYFRDKDKIPPGYFARSLYNNETLPFV